MAAAVTEISVAQERATRRGRDASHEKLCHTLTTTRVAHTPASVLGFPRCRPRGLRSQRGITSVTATESSPRPSWPGCTTNIAWNHWQREP